MANLKNPLLVALLAVCGLPVQAAPQAPLPSVLISPGGYLYAWGMNGALGLLGTGDTTNKTRPTLVRAVNPSGTNPALVDVRFVKVTVGNSSATGTNQYAIGLAGDGTLWHWGTNVYSARDSASEPATAYLSPKLIPSFSTTRWTDVSAGAYQVKALKDDGSLWEWGRTYDGSTQRTLQEVPQTSSTYRYKWVGLTTGRRYAGAWAATPSGNAGYFWGSDVDLEDSPFSNDSWAMCALPSAISGTNATAARTTMSGIPDLPSSLSPVVSYQTIVTSPHTSVTFTLDTLGNVKQCGAWPTSATTYAFNNNVVVGSGFAQISMNDNHCMMGVKSNGTLWAYGGKPGTWCHLALTSAPYTTSPLPLTQVSGLPMWKQVAVGYDFAIAIDKSGKLYTWGLNAFGQLGMGNTTASPSPTTPTLVDLSTTAGFPAGASSWVWQWVGASGRSAFAIRR